MNRFRPGAALAAALLFAAMLHAGDARAAAEVHRLNLVISGMPTQVQGDGFNEVIEQFNDLALRPIGNEPLDRIAFGWQYQSELRYFVRQNVSVNAGVSQLRVISKREFLPSLNSTWNIRAELLAVPVHLGASYYMQPYNQGDFQARAYVGGGLLSYTHTRATIENVFNFPGFSSGAFRATGTADGPGYYLEGGVHMFFALRYSVLLAVAYRNGDIRNLVDERTGVVLPDPKGRPLHVNLSGAGARLGIAIGL